MGSESRFQPGAGSLLITMVLSCGLDGCGADPRREAGTIEIKGEGAAVRPSQESRKGLPRKADQARVREPLTFPER